MEIKNHCKISFEARRLKNQWMAENGVEALKKGNYYPTDNKNERVITDFFIKANEDEQALIEKIFINNAKHTVDAQHAKMKIVKTVEALRTQGVKGYLLETFGTSDATAILKTLSNKNHKLPLKLKA